MIKKLITLATILILSSFSLYGCYSNTSIENYAYVVALGIDKGDTDLLKLTMQFATPSAISQQGSSQSESTSITSVECSSIDSGIAIINSHSTKQVNLSHCQVIIFSETICTDGIDNYIDTLMNDIEIRPDSNIVISRCDASTFINQIKPALTNLTSKYYEVLFNSEDYTGYTTTTPIWKVSLSSHDKMIQPIAVLAGIDTQGATAKSNQISSLIENQTHYKADELPITDNNKTDILGLAVFDGNKLVGELSAFETICYLIITNNLKSCTISIPSPFSEYESIDLILKINNSTKSTVKLVNNTPFITCNIELRAGIKSYSSTSNYSSPKNIALVEEYAASFMKSQITDFLYYTAKNLNSDILGFGYKTSSDYKNINDWIKSDWYSNYKNSFFNVNVDFEVKTASIFLKH